MRYNNYHKHTYYSNISTPDCIISIDDIAKRTKELNHTSLTTTEHGYAGNVFEYFDVAKKNDLKFVFGIEYYYVNDRFAKDKSNSHLMILAKNKYGMKQMNKILSESFKTGYYYKNRIDKDLLFSLNPEDVIVTSTCIMSYIGKHNDYEENFVIPLLSHFKDNFYLEVHDNEHIMQVDYNKKILELHNKYNIPLIHATDTHYIYPEDDKYRTEFLNGKNIYYSEEEGFLMDYPDSDEIFTRYKKQNVFNQTHIESALKNTWVIDDFENIYLDKTTVKMPSIYPELSHEEKVDKLKNILNEEWKKDRQEIDKSQHKKHIEAIQFETKIIEDTGMEDYFLLNYEVIKRAKENGGVLTRTGRGSAPSFYVNKLLGFTEIDRVDAPITLYPTRFMSKSRILETKSLPDIDFNTADPRPFIDATKEILGNDNVYYMVAYGRMKESEAFRNYCRAKGLKMHEYNVVAKDLDKYRDSHKWKDLIEGSKKFINVIDSVSPHPCAFLLLDKPISEEIGVIKIGDEYCALIDSGTSDAWKYLKNDFLTVTVWQIISETFNLIGMPIPNIRELNKLIEQDEKTWHLYSDGLTATLNQAGSDFGTPLVKQYKPKTIGELSAWVSAIRPSFASMKSIFLNRQPFSYGIDEFDKILSESANFVLYQENIMATLVYAGFPEDETYGLLKAIAKKKEGIIEPIHDRFIKGFVEKTGSEENALKVWRIIEDAVGYGFNSSHALSVAYDSVYGAYLKANYPLEYFTVILNKYEDNTDMTSRIFSELSYFNIGVEPIRFRKSQTHYSPDNLNNTIVKGLKSIKFLNEKIADELYELRSNKYNSFIELLIDITNNTSANSKQMEILIKLNFFSEFGENKYLLNIYDKFKTRYKKTHKEKTKATRLEEINQFVNTLNLNEKLIISEQLLFENEYLGYMQTTYKDSDENTFIITSINDKYTPLLYLYKLKTGDIIKLKVKKKKFYDDMGIPYLYVGDVITITGTSEEGKWYMGEDGNFHQNDTIMESYLSTCRLIERNAS